MCKGTDFITSAPPLHGCKWETLAGMTAQSSLFASCLHDARRVRIISSRLDRRSATRVRGHWRRKLNPSLSGRYLIPISLDGRDVAASGRTAPDFTRLNLANSVCARLGGALQTVEYACHPALFPLASVAGPTCQPTAWSPIDFILSSRVVNTQLRKKCRCRRNLALVRFDCG